MAEFIPAEVFPPGEFIRDELEARGWTQEDLATIMGRPLPSLNGIINGKIAITPETAQELAAAFGTSAELWLNLESAFRLSSARQDVNEVAQRARLYSLAPISDLIRRQWIKGADSLPVLERQLKEFYDVSALEEIQQVAGAARKSTSYAERTPAEIAWMARAKQMGRAVSASEFSREHFDDKLADLRELLVSEFEVRRIAKFLAEIGVRLVIIEHLPKTKIDGGTVWIDDHKPVVALSFRFDRIDNFWFTLSHEIDHIRNGEGSLDVNLVGPDRQPTSEKPDFEQRADREGANFLVPSLEVEKFIARVRPLFYKKSIVQFASRMKVHPGIVVGQLQYRDAIGYWHSREMLVKVRDMVTSSALTDGWGFAPPL